MSTNDWLLTEFCSPLYGYVRSLQLEKCYPRDAGCFCITGQRVCAGWGLIPWSAWPYEVIKQGWPPVEPPGLDDLARRARILHYIRVWDLDELKYALRRLSPVGCVLDATIDWFDAPNGDIPDQAMDTEAIGRHCVTVVGYDDKTDRLMFSNSWGDKWGNGGLGSVTCEYYRSRMHEAWLTEIPVNLKEMQPHAGALPVLNWGVWSTLGPVHGMEVYNPEEDERLGWAFATNRERGYLEVEDLFVRPSARQKGVGRELCEMLLELSTEFRLPLRLWVSEVDMLDNPSGVQAVADMLSLRLIESGVRWATRCGIPDVPNT